MKDLYVLANTWRCILPIALLRRDYLFQKDLSRWIQLRHLDGHGLLYSFSYLCLFYKEFRNVFLFRLNNLSKIKYLIGRLFWKPINTLFINTSKIGGGLFIEHGFATVISAKEIGENCWINQQVTIGYTNANDAPIIGNNVSIKVGAIVIGNIHVGDNSVVGAGAVVTHDVKENVIVAGVPAKVIRTINDKTTER